MSICAIPGWIRLHWKVSDDSDMEDIAGDKRNEPNLLTVCQWPSSYVFVVFQPETGVEVVTPVDQLKLVVEGVIVTVSASLEVG